MTVRQLIDELETCPPDSELEMITTNDKATSLTRVDVAGVVYNDVNCSVVIYDAGFRSGREPKMKRRLIDIIRGKHYVSKILSDTE